MKSRVFPILISGTVLVALLLAAFGSALAAPAVSPRAQVTVQVTSMLTEAPTATGVPTQAATTQSPATQAATPSLPPSSTPVATMTGGSPAATGTVVGSATVPGNATAAPAATGTPTAAPPPAGTPLPADSLAAALAVQQVFQSIYERVNPSVVNISTVSLGGPITGDTLPFDHPPLPDGLTESLGSGFVWDTAGHIVTNAHVVAGADEITVTFSDGTTAPAELVGAAEGADLAVIQVDVDDTTLLRPVTVGDSRTLAVGQLVVAIGSPLGLQGTMTTGIVSALNRDLPVGEVTSLTPRFSIPDIIQTDAAINPGNSGGVLVNIYGQVVGVNTAIRSLSSGNSGLGFAVPSAIVQRVVPALIDEGRFQFPFLGVQGTMLNDELRQQLELPASQRGFLVTRVTEGSPAEEASLVASEFETVPGELSITTAGDIITAIEGETLNSFSQLSRFLIEEAEVGQTITLTVLREGELVEVEVTLAARPEPVAATPTRPATTPGTPSGPGNTPTPGAGNGAPSGATYLGIVGTGLTPDIAAAMDLEEEQRGVLVLRVQAGSPAEEAGLLGSFSPAQINGDLALVGGDVITAVDGEEVAEMTDLQSALAGLQPGDEIELIVLRGGQEETVAVTLGARP